jgi:hypothetical protein
MIIEIANPISVAIAVGLLVLVVRHPDAFVSVVRSIFRSGFPDSTPAAIQPTSASMIVTAKKPRRHPPRKRQPDGGTRRADRHPAEARQASCRPPLRPPS